MLACPEMKGDMYYGKIASILRSNEEYIDEVRVITVDCKLSLSCPIIKLIPPKMLYFISLLILFITSCLGVYGLVLSVIKLPQV